jgi:hypothetical protein
MRLELLPKELIMKLDSDTLHKIMRDHIDWTINHHVNQHALGAETESSGQGIRLRDTLDSLDIMISQVRHYLEQGNHYHVMTEPMKRIVHKFGLNLDPDNPGADEKLLAFHLCKADIRAMEQAKRVLQTEPVFSDDRDYGGQPSDDAGTPQLQPESESDTNQQQGTDAPDVPNSITLQELVDQYTKHCNGQQKTDTKLSHF